MIRIAAGRVARRWGLVGALVAAVVAPGTTWAQRAVQKPGEEVELRFLDIGQGDAVLIRLPDGRHILIDAGRNATAVADLLSRERIDTLYLVVASHNHADHIGGLPEVFDRFVVQNYLANGIAAEPATYRRLVEAVERSGARKLRAGARMLNLGSVQLRVLSLPPGLTTQNENSVGLLLQFGEFRALLTGDSEIGELTYWLDNDSIPVVSLVKVPHHGAKNGTTARWVDATRPRVAVISVGRNGYGMPAQEVVDRWSRVARHVELTIAGGTVIIRATRDGKMILLRSDSAGLISSHVEVKE